MRLVYKKGSIEVWEVKEEWGMDYYVYGVTHSGDPRVCPSLGMAMEIAA